MSKLDILKDFLLDDYSMSDKESFRLSIDEIGDEVNRMDKSFGIRLRHPDKSKTPEACFKKAKKEAKEHMAKLIITLNGLHVKDYDKVKKGGNKKNVFYPYMIDQEEITETNRLNWVSKDGVNYVYDINTAMFKCRFLVNMITSLKFNLKGIVSKMTEVRSKRTTIPDKVCDMYLNLRDIMQDLDRFVSVFLHGDKYGNILLKMQQYSMYASDRYDNRKVNKKIREAVASLKSGLAYSLTQPRAISDDMGIDAIMKLAYMVSTGKSNLRGFIDFNTIENWTTDNENMKDLIEYLGSAIRKTNCVDKQGMNNAPFMYRAFISSNPTILTKFADCKLDRNKNLLTGIQALSYVAFLCNDKGVTKFVEELI